jgi:chemotaxis protein methyltransferase CheR
VSSDRLELGISRVGLPLLRDLISERLGLHYAADREDLLAERLASIAIDRGFHAYLDLFYLLKYDDDPSDWSRVMDELSVPETYFWREFDQVEAIVRHVVPELVARGPLPLRICSLPCASGEEPLTIAMALEEAGWFDRAEIELHGADGSPAAIARARDGLYRERSFRVLPAALKRKYFVEAPGGWRPRPSLSSRVASWTVANLLDPAQVASLATAPVIFCRNAFIYFSPVAIRRAAAIFADGMPTPGYLCIGASESLLNVTSAFTLQALEGAFVYVKR